MRGSPKAQALINDKLPISCRSKVHPSTRTIDYYSHILINIVLLNTLYIKFNYVDLQPIPFSM